MSESVQSGRGVRYRSEWNEDWKTGGTAGRLGWTVSSTGGGATTMVLAPPVVQVSSTVLVLSAGSAIRFDNGAWDLSNNAIFEIEWTGSVSHSPTGVDPFFARIGCIDNNTATPLDGFWFLASAANPGLWVCETSNAGAVTPTVTSVVQAADPSPYVAPQRFKIRATLTQVIFSINGVVVATHTTNIPAVGAFWGPGASIRKDSVTLGTIIPMLGMRRCDIFRQEGSALLP